MSSTSLQVSHRSMLIILTIYAACAFLAGVFKAFLPSENSTDTIGTFLNGTFVTMLLLYYWYKPTYRQKATLIMFFFICTCTLILPSWYYSFGTFAYGWTFVEVFPPISGTIFFTTISLLLLMPKGWSRYVLVAWCVTSLPILVTLTFHLAQLNTPRGEELLMIFGPGSGLLFLVLEYKHNLLLTFSQKEVSLKQSRRMADHDTLTGLLNRRGLEFWLSNQTSSNTTFGTIIIDIDNFKNINDQFGHLNGDSVLQQTAGTLKKCIGDTDCLARWGGDEFVILLTNTNSSKLQQYCNECLKGIRELNIPNIGSITCSIGASLNNTKKELSCMIETADINLYSAKQRGRNQAVVNVEKL